MTVSKKIKFLFITLLLTTLIILIYLNKTTKSYAHVKHWRPINEKEEINKLAQKKPNLPIKFWYTHRGFNLRLNHTCAEFPDVTNIHLVHNDWQQLELVTAQTNIKLFSAHLDDRPQTHTVRLLVMIDQPHPISIKTWCQLWFHDHRQPIIVPVEEYFYLWHDYWGQKPPGVYQPYLLSCKLPPDFGYGQPSVVSLVEGECDYASNALRVHYDKNFPTNNNLSAKQPKPKIGVCTKGVNFVDDITVRLVEWIELMSLLGVDKIHMYHIIATPQVHKLYDYYTLKGLLEITPLPLPQLEINEPVLQHLFLEHDANMQSEVIPYNHCFLMHMYKYDYIMIVDTDEVIMPIVPGDITSMEGSEGFSLQEMILKANERALGLGVDVGSFIARNCYFFDNSTFSNYSTLNFSTLKHRGGFVKGSNGNNDLRVNILDVPDFMHMSQHVLRSLNCTPPGFYIKSIHNTKAVVAVHNHFNLKVLDDGDGNDKGGGGKWVNFDFDMELEGYMHHYRNGCPGELKDVCYEEYQKDLVVDDSILVGYEELRRNVVGVLDDLGYF